MVLRFLKRLFQPKRQRPDLQFLVYTRRSCPLCDEALVVLQRFQLQYGFDVQTKDVDEAPDLVREYGNCVPVVLVNGKVRFRGHVNAMLLKRLLEAP